MFLLIFINYSFFFNYFYFDILNILIILDFILIGGILPLIERKELALIQRRVGPKLIGLNGRLQFLLDALKIFFKHYFILIKVKKYSFFVLPILFFFVNIWFVLNFIWYNNVYVYGISLNIIYVLVFSIISNILVMLTGFFCKNKYTILSSSRSVMVIFINDILFTVIICKFLYLSKSFFFADYINFFFVFDFNNFFVWIFDVPVLILIFLLDISKPPFDFLEAESELIMGYTTEYVGFLFGIYILMEYIHIFIYSYLLSIFLL